MLYQTVYIILALSALVAGFFAGRKIHHWRISTLLWVVLFIGVLAMSPEVMDILSPILANATGISQGICSKLIAFATVFGGGVFFALTLPPPGTFSARSRE
jgi:hypothetical protein